MSHKTLAAGAALLAACAPTAGAQAQTTFAPGYYETTLRVAGDPEPEVQRECVTPAEAKTRTVEVMLSEWTEGKCAYSQRQVGGGKFALAGSCVLDGARSTFRYAGAYTPTSLSATLSSRTVVSGQPLDMNTKISSRRIAPTCPAGRR